MIDRSEPPATTTSLRIQLPLQHLLTAHECSRDLGKDPWQFAVEVDSLRSAGLSNSALRWLVCQGYLEHGLEETQRGDAARTFRAAPNLSLDPRSCFVLTAAGLDLARLHAEPAEGVRARTATGPYWDDRRRTLFWDGRVVKHYRYDAPNQELVLKLFQTQGWARCVEVILPDDGGGSYKERTHDTIKNLNRSVRPFLRFRQAGSWVSWEQG
jgi:hypothetical protein